ncbi:hypothetical protein MRB53_010401 [Persea americana]|uniref:Uncharacterized protein n=1 Tax=Persea americana TaxID=3435 RepID=A0ACC2LSW6_PERAE|nr:hypothetical protein MRB53_010401 [Persea americana]
MFGETSHELQVRPYWKNTRFFRRAAITVKFHDIYAFTVEGNVNDINVMNEVRERMQRQRQVWWALEASKGENWYQEQNRVSSLRLFVVVNSIMLRRLIRKGIPPVLRPKVWFSVSGAAKKRSAAPESYYDDLIKAVEGKDTPAALQIDNGLNYVAALLLLVMKREEDAFWMLAVLLEDILVNDCYTDNLSGCNVEQRVFRDLLYKKCPRIATHLEAIELDASVIATEWFICLFSKSLPSEMNEEEVLNAHQIEEVVSILQKSAHHLFDPDKLLTVAFNKIGPMTIDALTRERKRQKSAVMAEIDQRLRLLNSPKIDDK